MQTTSVNSAYDTQSSTLGSAAAENALDKDAFLNLLITQIRYQDPLKPLDDKEFIAQLAQFSSLEQMQQVNKNLTALAGMNATAQAASLLGKEVLAFDEHGHAVEGRVEAVLFDEGIPWLKIGETTVTLDRIARVQP